MTFFDIKSDKLNVRINSKGAELSSLVSSGGSHNWIWDGGEVWARRAPLLFPIVGKLRNDQYVSDEKTYSLSQHGFARDSIFDVIKITADEVVFSLSDTKASLDVYPFKFNLKVSYKVQGDCLSVGFAVLNADVREIYFNFGWHPGFVAPWGNHEGSVVSSEQQFGRRSYLVNGLLSESLSSFVGAREISLTQDSFAEDAMVFKDMHPGSVKWSHPDSDQYLMLNCGDAPHLGVWTKDLSKFLCLEPWWGLADSETASGDFEHKEGVFTLAPGKIWEAQCSIRVGVE